MSNSGKRMKFRLRLVCTVFMAVFAAVLYKSYTLQVVEREELVNKAKTELESFLTLGSVRGEIFDVNGERLAASLAITSAYVDAKIIDDELKEGVAEQLSEILGLEFEWVKEKLATNQRYIRLKRYLSVDEIEALKQLKLRALILSKEYRRAYPNNNLASHFLGFVGNENKGLEGLEKGLDDLLKPVPNLKKVKRDRRGRTMIDVVDEETDQAKGASVVLTIDRRIQYITEKALANAVQTYGAKSGMILVMRPKTGAVVAAATWPTFDPNSYDDAPEASRRNRIMIDSFEPGSTFKVFVVAAALEENVISPDSVIHCENGAFKVSNHTVKDTHSYGDLTVSQVIKHSSNIGSLKIGGLLGNDMLYNYLTRFNFGDRTGLPYLPGESSGRLRHPKRWYQLDAANIAFGQGLSVTSMQMVTALSALANDGVLMRPYIVDRVLDADGRIIEQYEPQIIRQVVSPMTARQVAAMLRMAVQKGGTGAKADVEGYPVAGKTGTAQKVVRGGKTYAQGKYVASFMGYAPYHDPQLAVMVVLDEPRNGYYGGTVATPAFKEIMENALPLLDVPPTEDRGDPVWPLLQRNSVGAPGVLEANQPSNFIKVKLKKSDIAVNRPIKLIGEDYGLTAKNGAGSPLADADVSIKLTADPGVMPNLAGLSMRQVLEVMSEYGMEMEFLGSGHVVGQSPLPGTAVMAGQAGSVFFERQ